MDLSHLVQDSDFVNRVMNLRVSLNIWNFLSG
jgi:hypothetical protein